MRGYEKGAIGSGFSYVVTYGEVCFPLVGSKDLFAVYATELTLVHAHLFLVMAVVFCLLSSVYPSPKARRLLMDDSYSSPQSYQGERWKSGLDIPAMDGSDLIHLHKVVEEKDGGPIWIQMMITLPSMLGKLIYPTCLAHNR